MEAGKNIIRIFRKKLPDMAKLYHIPTVKIKTKYFFSL